MIVDSQPIKPIWLDETSGVVKVIDQRQLPHRLVIMALDTVEKVVTAIQTMAVRGAPLLGVTGAYGVYVAATTAPDDSDAEAFIRSACRTIRASRPTAVNLVDAVNKVESQTLAAATSNERIATARDAAGKISQKETENGKMIGQHGMTVIAAISHKKGGQPVNILTHCNAGWLACIE